MDASSSRPDDTPSTRNSVLSAPPATTSMLPTVIHLPARRTLTPWLVGVAIVALVVVFRQTLTLAFVGFATAYVLAPSVRRVETLGVPRPLAIALVLLAGVALLGTVVAVLVPELVRQTESLVRSIPEYSNAIQRDWIPWLRQRLHLRIPPRTGDALAHLGVRASEIAPRIGGLLNDTLAYTIVVLEYLLKGLIVLALVFYFLLDFEGLLARAFDLVPHRARVRVRAMATEIDENLRHFVSGQLLVMAILGVLYALGLGALRVPAGWAIGLFAGMISFVPYLGFFVALGLAALMALLQGRGVPGVLAVAGVMTAVHILDLTLITPRIVGGRAKLSPIVVILSLIAGGSVFGFVGILVAIPVASVLRVLLAQVVAYYKTTPFFITEAPPNTALESVAFGATPSALQSDLADALILPSIPLIKPPPTASIPPGAPTPFAPGPGAPGASTSAGAATTTGPATASPAPRESQPPGAPREGPAT